MTGEEQPILLVCRLTKVQVPQEFHLGKLQERKGQLKRWSEASAEPAHGMGARCGYHIRSAARSVRGS